MSYNKQMFAKMVEESKKKKSLSKPKDRIVDPMGQWAHPGQVTRIPSNRITMQGVPYPVLGVGNNGQQQMMYPGQEYAFPGSQYVDEYPLMQAQDGAVVDPSQDFLKNWYTNRVITDPYIQGAFDLDKPAYLKNLQNFPEYTYVDNIDNDPRITGRHENGKLLITKNAPEHIKTHELNHYLNSNGAGDYMRTIHNDIVRNELLPESELSGPYKEKYEYFSRPDEVHSRIMVLREKAGFKPNEIITPEKLRSFFETYKGDVDNINDLLEMSRGEEGLLNMLNFMAKGKSPSSKMAQYGGEPEPTSLELAKIKAKMALESHFGNPAARRMTTPYPQSLVFKEQDGKIGRGTHYVYNQDNFVVPTIQEGSNGKLFYNQNASPNDREAMRFNSPEDAESFAQYYKHVAPMMRNFKNGGDISILNLEEGGWLNRYDEGGLTTLTTTRPGPIVVPYSQDYINKEYDKYNKFYEGYYRVPYLRKDDKFDAYYHEKLKDVPSVPQYHTGWVKEFPSGDKVYTTKQPKSSANYNVRQVENEISGYIQDPSKVAEANRMVKSFTNYKPSTVLGFKNGGQLQQFEPGGAAGFATTFTTTLKPISNQERQYLNHWVNQSKSNNQNTSILNKPQQTSTGLTTSQDLYRAAGINLNQKPQVVIQPGYVAGNTSKEGAVQINKVHNVAQPGMTYNEKVQQIRVNDQKKKDDERRAKEEEERQIKEREAAAATRAKVIGGDDNATFTFPNGQTKVWKDMDWREQAYVSGKNLGSWNNNNVTDWINPLSLLGSLGEGIGTSAYTARETNSIMPYVTGFGAPLLTGALAGIGSKTTGQFVNNLVNPVAGVNFRISGGKPALNLSGNSAANYMTTGPAPNPQLVPVAEKAALTIEQEGANILKDLTSQEGRLRLRNQFKTFNPQFTDAQLDHLVDNRITEVANAVGNNQARFFLDYGKGALGSPTFGLDFNLVPNQNAHFSNFRNYNTPYSGFYLRQAPKDLNFSRITMVGNGPVNKFGNPDFVPGSITLGSGYETSRPTVRHEVGHAVQGSATKHETARLPLESDLLELVKPKSFRDKLWHQWKLRTDPFYRGQYDYFTSGREAYPFLTEQRQVMLQDKILNNTYDEITIPKLVQAANNRKARLNNYFQGRTFGIGNKAAKPWSKLSFAEKQVVTEHLPFTTDERLINLFPSWKRGELSKIINVAPAIGMGVGTTLGMNYLLNNSSNNNNFQQKLGGETNNWLDKYN
jgi:hypothetical protein